MSFLNDTFRQVVNGLTRIGRPGSAQPTWSAFTPLTQGELVSAYRSDWLSRKIVDVPAEDQTREWRTWQADDAQVQALEDEEARLNVRGVVADAIRLSRLTGGAAILVGTGARTPAELEQPLDPNSIGRGGITFLAALDRYQLPADELQRDPNQPGFMEPRAYTIQTALQGQDHGVKIHPTRLVRFIGKGVPAHLAPEAMGWGDSVLEAARQAIMDAGISFSTVASLIQEAKVDVVQVTGLMQQVATQEYTDRLKAKYELAAQLKSTLGVLLLDASENWETKQVNFANLAELLDRFMQAVSGAADIPATRLFGRAPAGLNATGESDGRNYYDAVAGQQKVGLGPRLRPLDHMLVRSALGSRPPAVHYAWNPLWQETDQERTDRFAKLAEALTKLASTGLIPQVALRKGVQNAIVDLAVFPGFEQALEEAEKAGEVAPFEEEPAANENTPTGTPPANAVAARRQAPTPAPRDAPGQGQRTLYVSRPVLNGDAIRAWARGQGFDTTLDPADMHVTLAYSKLPVDWANMPAPATDTITVEGDRWRYVEQLGDAGAVVLFLEDERLQQRWQAFVDAGASWDYAGFHPHVTLTYQAGGKDLWQVVAYQGPIQLGPEQWAEVNEGWGGAPSEVSTEA